MNKKSLVPVIMISMLLVVSVVAVGVSNNWYKGFSSKVFSDLEKLETY